MKNALICLQTLRKAVFYEEISIKTEERKIELEKTKRLNNSSQHRKGTDTLGSGNTESLNYSVLNNSKKMFKTPEEGSFK